MLLGKCENKDKKLPGNDGALHRSWRLQPSPRTSRYASLTIKPSPCASTNILFGHAAPGSGEDSANNIIWNNAWAKRAALNLSTPRTQKLLSEKYARRFPKRNVRSHKDGEGCQKMDAGGKPPRKHRQGDDRHSRLDQKGLESLSKTLQGL
jgi:hypothetical protein